MLESCCDRGVEEVHTLFLDLVATIFASPAPADCIVDLVRSACRLSAICGPPVRLRAAFSNARQAQWKVR